MLSGGAPTAAGDRHSGGPHLVVAMAGTTTDWTAEFDYAEAQLAERIEVQVTKVSTGAGFTFQTPPVATDHAGVRPFRSRRTTNSSTPAARRSHKWIY